MPSDTDQELQAIYDYARPFSANYRGPLVDLDPPPTGVLEVQHPRSLLGHPVGYPIGVPASPLTANAEWVGALANQGFNVLTYKTVRSVPRDAFPEPNWFFVDGLRDPLPIECAREDVEVIADGSTPPQSGPYSMVNSFGMPSMDPENWMPDVANAIRALAPGQILMVSVVGTYEIYSGVDLLRDFVRVAQMAEKAGARAIELNLSCPNTLATDGSGMGAPICEDPKHTREIVRAVRAELDSDTKLVAKLGYLVPARLAEVVDGIATQVDGIAGINTLQVTVKDAAGHPAFRGTPEDPDRDRPKAGLSGVAIRGLALDFVRELALLRREREWSFDIIGMGGVMNTHDVRALMASGADAVQATSLVANNIRFAQNLWKDRSMLETILEDSRWDFRSAEGLAEDLRLSVDITRDLLETSPDVARRTVMKDRLGRGLYTARRRPPTMRERIQRFRSVL